MSNNTTDTTTTTETETTVKGQKGQKRRTEEELRAAFASAKQVLGAAANPLTLQIDQRGRCSVLIVDGDSARTVVEPTAGNTFLNLLEGARSFAPFSSL